MILILVVVVVVVVVVAVVVLTMTTTLTPMTTPSKVEGHQGTVRNRKSNEATSVRDQSKSKNRIQRIPTQRSR